MPVLQVHGENDESIPVEAGRRLTPRLRDSRFVVIEGASHDVHIDAPDRLAAFVEAAPAFCDPCSLRETCQGGCKAAAQVCYGSLSAEEPFLHLNRAGARPLARR